MGNEDIIEVNKKYWRKCKRKKIPFDKNEALKKINLFSEDYPRQYEIDLVECEILLIHILFQFSIFN